MSYKPVVKVCGESGWHANGLRFATREEAVSNAVALMDRWTMATDADAQESDDPPNYRWVNGKLEAIE